MLGKHSGRAALAARAKALGFRLTGEQLNTVFEAFKRLADKKKEIYDGDLAALVEEQIQGVADVWTLDSYEVTSGTNRTPHVVLKIRKGDEVKAAEMDCGDGPVDAIFLAIEELTGFNVVCSDYRVHSVTVGKDAQGEVNVQLEYEGNLYRGRGVSTDSVEAAVKAFLNAINRIVSLGDTEQETPNPNV